MSARLVAAGFLVAGVLFLLTDEPTVGAVALGLGLLILAFIPVVGVPVSPSDQPDLWAVVTRLAAQHDTTPPARIWLTHDAVVELRGRRRKHLLIGQPLFACLSDHELNALLAHALVGPRGEDAADRAASAAAGHPVAAARAFAVVHSLEWAYTYDFVADLDLPRRGWPRVALEDLDEVWRRVVREGFTESWWLDDSPDELGEEHPALANAFHDLSDPDLELRPPTTAIALRPLTRRARRRLARQWQGISPLTPVRWYTVDTAPQELWAARAGAWVARLRRDAGVLLGRQPTDHVELAEVFLRRTDELLAIRVPEAGRRPEPDGADADEPSTPPGILFLVEDALFARGWRLEHPAIRGVLTGPRGERVDARTLALTWDQPGDLDQLRAVLRGS